MEPQVGTLRQEDSEPEPSLGYTMKSYLKHSRPFECCPISPGLEGVGQHDQDPIVLFIHD